MVRLETNLSSQLANQELERLIQVEAKKLRPADRAPKKRSCLSCFNCLIVLIVSIGILLSLAAFLVAKTGLIFVPIFSDMFYRVPKPLHVVSPAELKSVSWEDKLQQSWDGHSAGVKISLTEGELNQILQEGLMQMETENSNLKVKHAQISIDTSGIEIFSQLEKPREIYLIVDLLPTLQNDKWQLVLKEVRMGDLAVPKIFTSFFTKTLLEKINAIWEDVPLTIENLSLRPGKIIIEGQVIQY